MILSVYCLIEGLLRGNDSISGTLFSYVDLEERIPARHPLRLIAGIVNDVLAGFGLITLLSGFNNCDQWTRSKG